MRQVRTRTDWSALLLSLLAQAPLAGWLVWLAYAPLDEHRETIADTLALLLPFELVRGVLLSFSRSAFRDYKGPWPAVKAFLVAVALFVGLALVATILPSRRGFTLSGVVAALSHPWIWQAFLVPIFVLVAENASRLFLFRGDARAEAARLDAMSDDAWTWLFLATLAGFPIAVVYMLAHANEQEWTETTLLFAAAYFAGKAIVFAQPYTARFASTGRRALAWRWLIRLNSSGSKYADSLAREQRAAEWRRSAMLGEDAPFPQKSI